MLHVKIKSFLRWTNDGVEGCVESAASVLAGINAVRLQGEEPVIFPQTTAIGALPLHPHAESKHLTNER